MFNENWKIKNVDPGFVVQFVENKLNKYTEKHPDSHRKAVATYAE